MGSSKILKYKVIVDTNVLLQSVRHNIDLFEKLGEALLAKFEVLLPDLVIKELENLRTKGRLIERKEATLILNLIKDRVRIISTKQSFSKIDDALLSLAIDYGAILLTNDRELRRKARLLRVPVARLNIKEGRIYVEGVFD